MPSYWEQQSFTTYHHVVIGAGLVGLSTAIEIKQRFPGERVMVLERGLLPTGATTRNAGFACMGSATELVADLLTSTEEEVTALFLRRRSGLQTLRSRLGDAALGYKEEGGYELISGDALPVLDKLDYLNALLRPALGKNAFRIASHRIKGFGFSKSSVSALTENTCEGSIHSGRTMRSLTDMTMQQGIEVKTGAEVISFDESRDHISIQVRDPFREKAWQIRSDTLSICTNAFAGQLLPGEDVIPGRGQVLITHPVPGLPFKGIFHFDKGYYYFRELDGRVLFGGGRNLDFEGERTTAFELSERIQQDLEDKLRDIILPNHPFTIDRRWAGIMAFGATKAPIIKAFSKRLFGAFRMGGMGVALGSGAAADLAALVAAGR